MTHAVGIDIGGTKTVAGIVDESGAIRSVMRAPTPAAHGAQAVLDTAVRLARQAVEAAEAPVVAVGIGAAGVIDSDRRVVVSATDTLPGWAGTELGAAFEHAFGVPVAAVNDVHAHAVGEATFGAGAGLRSTLVAAAGTGIGGAQVIDGALELGAHGVAGHFGHVPAAEAAGLPCTCGRVGHLEMIAAGPAIAAAYQRRMPHATPIDTREVVALAAAGDQVACDVVDTASSALGRALGGLVNAIDPDAAVITGGLADTGERWWSGLRAGFAGELMPVLAGCALEPAVLGSDAAVIGAAVLGLRRAGLSAGLQR